MINRNSQIKLELAKNAFDYLFTSLLGFSLIIFVITYALWNIVDNTLLSIWTITLFCITTTRAIHAKRSLKYLNTDTVFKMELQFKALTLLSASIVSLGILTFLPNDLIYQSFIIITLAELSSGAVMSLSFYRKIVTFYIIILLFPFALQLLYEGSTLQNLIALLTIAYLFMLIKFASKYNQNIIDVITSRLKYEQAQKELQLSKDYFSTIFEQAPVGLCTYDQNLIIKSSNQALADLLHVPVEKLIRMDLKSLPDDSLRPTLDLALLGEKGFYEGKYRSNIQKLNLWINMQTAPLYNTNHNIEGGLVIVSDITQRVHAEEKIRYQAFYDHLTSLANRATLYKRLEEQLIKLIKRKRFGALIFIDLDHFKTINDSLGHDIGDEVLKEFANRIQTIIRREDTFARLGGDEFVILLPELSHSYNVAEELVFKIAKKCHELMDEPFIIKKHSLYITLSQGITIIGEKSQDVNTILKNADIAMYEAKKSGRSNTKFFEECMTSNINQQLQLDHDLREAINNDQFELYFQPIVQTQTNNIVSCEALIRWNHPTKGIIYPDIFIPFAEESGLIILIGDWVIKAACKAYNNWNKQTKEQIQSIAINISPKQFNQNEFVEQLTQTLSNYELAPNIIKLELTESVAIDNLDKTIDKIKELQDLGFQMVMDDFGTGYSSLSYLKNLPFDIIKIDRTFIQNVLVNAGDKSLVKIILSISKQFNFEVVAEGVEQSQQRDFLQSIECKYYQGYYMSKPLHSKEFEELVLTRA